MEIQEACLTQIQHTQGTPEWLELRRTKITATDASVIMGISPWKTKLQLYHEKLSGEQPIPPNERMQRGIDMEPSARDLFIIKMGIHVEPKVIVKDWQMASLDGICEDGKCVVEIKCPSKAAHAVAVQGKVPYYYYAQLQHQIHVCDVGSMYYFSFDGIDGVIVEVDRNGEYIEKMVEDEFNFYNHLINKIPPENEDIVWPIH